MMTILDDSAILVAPSYRSRAYAQGLVSAGIIPGIAIVLPGDEPLWEGEEKVIVEIVPGKVVEYRPAERAVETLKSHVPRLIHSPVADINRPEFIELVQGLDVETIIYSGLGGVLLKKPLLDAGKRFLHVHGGYAPQYRGSTAFYYSVLNEGTIGATAIWLVKEIDAGPVLLRRKYVPPPGVEVDRILDPLVRTDVLIDVLKDRVEKGHYAGGEVVEEGAETYHVVHPVLKHLALNRLGLTSSSK